MLREGQTFLADLEVEGCTHIWKPKYAQGTIRKCIYCTVIGFFNFRTKTTEPQRCSASGCVEWATRVGGKNWVCAKHKKNTL